MCEISFVSSLTPPFQYISRSDTSVKIIPLLRLNPIVIFDILVILQEAVLLFDHWYRGFKLQVSYYMEKHPRKVKKSF